MTTLVDKFSSLIDYANDRRDTKYTNLTDIIANELNAEQTPVTHIPSATIEERTQSLIDYANEKCNTSYDNLTDVILNDLKGQRTYSIEEKEPYIYRKTANGLSVGGQKQETIVGGSIVWNQKANPSKYAEKTRNGITFSLGDDGSITANGTATDDTYFDIFVYFGVKQNGEVENVLDHKSIVIGCPAGGSASTYFLFVRYVGTANNYDTGNGIIEYVAPTQFNGSTYICIKNGTTVNNIVFKPQVFDLTQMFGSEVADGLYAMEQANAGSGVAAFRSMFPNEYYEYNAGELKSVEGLQKHVTTGFNLWDEEWEPGGISHTTGQDATTSGVIRIKGYIDVFGGLVYSFAKKTNGVDFHVHWYDADKNFISYAEVYSNSTINYKTATAPANARYMRFNLTTTYGTTYNHDICVNISDPSKNGTYEPYKANTYPLDSDIVLRGIPKFANVQIYFDGDTYESDGKVTRKYGIVDLGTLTWTHKEASNSRHLFTSYDLFSLLKGAPANNVSANAMALKYDIVPISLTFADRQFGIDNVMSTNKRVVICDNSFTDAASFKASLRGQYLVYELAEPTTETADPFTNPQIVSKYGTEEYVTTGLVPVGHDTKYSTD